MSKTDHMRFRELGRRVIQASAAGRDRIFLNATEIEALAEHAAWFELYVRQQQRKAKSNPNPGRKRKPDDEILPASLARRRKREEQTNE